MTTRVLVPPGTYNLGDPRLLIKPSATLCPLDRLLRTALDYSPKRWGALARYLEDGAVPIEFKLVANLIRPGHLAAQAEGLLGLYVSANEQRKS
jgi:hypothetical protein